MKVGNNTEGTLNISGRWAWVSNRIGYIGNGSDSVGTVTVTGQGSEWNNSNSLYVGRYGTGTLNIEGGGVVTSSYGSIGNISDSVGTVTVTGEGSEWNNSGSLYVGNSEGTLNIADGGVVNVSGTTTLNNSTLHIELSESNKWTIFNYQTVWN